LKSKLPKSAIPLSEADTLKLLHELEVHQIELELQHEELLKAKEFEIRHESERRSRNTLDHMLESCQIIGFDWKYIYLNRSAEVQNRRPNKELIGNRYQNMWPGIGETEVFKLIRRALNDRVSSHLENKFSFPDGSQGWFDMSIQPVPEGVFILSIDITKRKNAEEALRESKEKYQLIADNSDDWVYWKTPEGNLKYLSPACQRITGYLPEEFYEHQELIHEIVYPNEKELFWKHSHIPQQDDTPHHIEFRIKSKSGETRWISHSCSPIYSPEGEFLGRRGTNRDITDFKRNEDRLLESEFRFNKLFEDGPFGMAMVNSEFKFEKVNPAFSKMMGYTEEELQELTIKDLTHPDDLTKDLHHVLKLINQEISVYKTEKRYIRKDGQVIWGSLKAMANYNRDGQFLYNLAIIEDITPRKQAEEDLRERENKLSTIFNLLPVGISILDRNRKIVYENPALESILDITMEGLLSGDYRKRKYLRSDGTPKPANEFASTLAFNEKKAKHNFITGVEKEDGHIVWTNVSAVPVEFADWKVILVTSDITSIKQTEEALIKNKKILSETESLGKVGGWEVNVDSMEQSWTEEVYRIHEVDFDFNPNLEKGINFYTIQSRPIVEKAIQRAIQFGEPFDFELEIITAKGNLRKVHAIGKADLENRRVYGFFQDVTERRNLEDKIHQKDLEFRKLSANAPGMIFQLTRRPDGSIYVPIASEGIRNIYGCSPEDVLNDFGLIGNVIYTASLSTPQKTYPILTVSIGCNCLARK
jgi:PAS domain S-box-containing protein